MAREEEKIKRRNPLESRNKILRSAMVHFGRAGLDGARVVDIIKDAGLSHRMLYHYFDSKESLYLATLEYAYQSIRSSEMQLRLSHLEPVDAIERFINFTFDYYIENPEFMGLLNQENLNGGEFVKQIPHIEELQRPLLLLIDDIFRRGKETGAFQHNTPNPMHFYFDIVGMCYFAIAHRHTLATVFDPLIAGDSFLVERKKHIIDFTLSTLVAA
ncbi:TetR family transcriptional regulator [Roseibium sp. M-1]